MLAEVRGKPFITYLLRQLILAGFPRAVISIGYGADRVVDELGASYDGLALDYCREDSPLGTGGAARLALDHAGGGPVMTMNGDSIVNAPLSGFVQAALAVPDEPMLLAVKVPDVSRYGSLEIRDSRVVRFAEKGGQGEGWINAGVYYFPGPLLERLPLGETASLEKDVLEKLGGRLRAFTCDSDFIDIGTPESYAAGPIPSVAGEVMLDDQVMIYVPTYNRHAFLKRVLDYYGDSNIRVLASDDSREPFAEAGRLPEPSFTARPGCPLPSPWWTPAPSIFRRPTWSCAPTTS